MTDRSMFDKIQNVDARGIYLLISIILGAVLIAPVGLPLVIGEQSKALYSFVNNLPAGSVVLFSNDISPAFYTEVGYTSEAIFKQILDLPIKLIVVSFAIEGPISYQRIMSKVSVPPDKIYGRDYVYLGFFSGGETAVAAFGVDIHSVATRDFQGTPIDQLPIMKDVKSAKDLSLVIDAMNDVTWIGSAVRQWSSVFNRPLAVVGHGELYSTAIPYYPKQIIAVVPSLRGAAEYEFLTGFHGSGLAASDSLSAGHIFLILLIAVANVGAYGSRREKKK